MNEQFAPQATRVRFPGKTLLHPATTSIVGGMIRFTNKSGAVIEEVPVTSVTSVRQEVSAAIFKVGETKYTVDFAAYGIALLFGLMGMVAKRKHASNFIEIIRATSPNIAK